MSSRKRNEIIDAIKDSLGGNANDYANGNAPQPTSTETNEPQPIIEIPTLKSIKKESRKTLKLINSNPSFPLVINKKVANSLEDLQRIYGELLVQENDIKIKERMDKRNAKKSEMEKKKKEFLDRFKEDNDIKKPKDDYPEDEYHISDGIVRKVGGVCGVIDGDNVIEVPKISKKEIDTFLDSHKDYILERIAQQTDPENAQREIVRDYIKEKETEEPILRKGTNAFSGDFSNRVLNQWFSKYPVRDAQQVVKVEHEEPKITQPNDAPQQRMHMGLNSSIVNKLNPALFNRR